VESAKKYLKQRERRFKRAAAAKGSREWWVERKFETSREDRKTPNQ